MGDYIKAIIDVADLFRLKMHENSHYLHYLNDLLTPRGYNVEDETKVEVRFVG